MLWPRFTAASFKIMKDTSRKQQPCLFCCAFFFSFCCFKSKGNDRSPFYFNVHRVSVGWVMSQLSLAAEVVWLLELTATIRPNSAVMSVAEEAGIAHFKTLLQRWAHPVFCFRRTWAFHISAKSIQSHCSSPPPPSPEVGVIVITRWIMNHAESTSGKSRLGAHAWGMSVHTNTQRLDSSFFFYCVI